MATADGAGFEAATSLQARGGGTFGAALHADWTVGGIPNGGYLLALLALAGNRVLGGTPAPGGVPDGPAPVAATAYFVQRAAVGPADVTVEPLRAGRTLRHLRATLHQDGEPRVHALLTFADLDGDVPVEWTGHRPVDLPPEQECPRIPVSAPGVGFDVGIMAVVEQRLDPAPLAPVAARAAGDAAADGAGEAAGDAGGGSAAELRGWLRFPAVERVDPYRLLFALDSLPPATFPLGMLGWVPTVELTANVRALPVAGPLRARQRARSVHGGFVDETCEIWDAAGRLVAHATQLARAPRGPRV